jgi:hypothetical protein
VMSVLRGNAFRQSVAHLEGYDARDCGRLLELEDGLMGERVV